MAHKIITGFRINSNDAAPVSAANLDLLRVQMKEIVTAQANTAFCKLLQDQVERYVDELCSNQIGRPDCSILEASQNEVMRRIRYAEQAMQPTEFNLSAGVQFFSISHGGICYDLLKLNAPNDIYSKALTKKIPELIPFDLSSDADKKSITSIIWNEVFEKYEEDTMICFNLLKYDDLKVDIKRLSFHSPSVRAERMAREKVLSHLLSCYACDQEIPPFKLMDYFTQAVDRFQNEQIAPTVKEEAERINFLPEITEELITQTGGMPSAPDTTKGKEDDDRMTVEEEVSIPQ